MIRSDLSIATGESLIVVNSLNLSKTFCDKSSFVDSNITISVSLLLEDPFILYGSPIIGQVHQSLHFVLIHGSYLRFHGLKPFIGIWAHHSFFIVRRFAFGLITRLSLIT